ncbi:MAG: hypothetical protein WC792_06140 [Candidatus Micrarchaeia archaeon]|jgi:hypothetical protein
MRKPAAGKKTLKVALVGFPANETDITPEVLEAVKSESARLAKNGMRIKISVAEFGPQIEMHRGGVFKLKPPTRFAPRPTAPSAEVLVKKDAERMLWAFRKLKRENDLVITLGGSHAFAYPTYVDVPEGKIIARFDHHGDAGHPREIRQRFPIGDSRENVHNFDYVWHALKREPLANEHPLEKSKIINFGKPDARQVFGHTFNDILTVWETKRVGKTRPAKTGGMRGNIDTLCIDMDAFHEKYGLSTEYTQSDALLKHAVQAAKSSAQNLRTMSFFEYFDDEPGERPKTRAFITAMARAALRHKANAFFGKKSE